MSFGLIDQIVSSDQLNQMTYCEAIIWILFGGGAVISLSTIAHLKCHTEPRVWRPFAIGTVINLLVIAYLLPDAMALDPVTMFAICCLIVIQCIKIATYV